MDKSELTQSLKREAGELGFDHVGVCPAVTPNGIHLFHQWLERGYAGEMRYLPDRLDAYDHPRHVLDGVRSLVMLAMNYRTCPPRSVHPGEGRVSCYAWGEVDYHDRVHDRLDKLADLVHHHAPTARVRGVVDTAPLLEREFAQLAGLGWIGKHTLLLNRSSGSWFFLAALLTDQELDYDPAMADEFCGSCTACLDACPTNAFPEPYVLDATKCISYLTIELRESIPQPLRNGIGDWLFGCDICQEVCPWNQRAPLSTETAFHPLKRNNPVTLTALFDLDDAQFRTRFRKTPFWRARRRGILRNAAIVLGNQRAAGGEVALVKGIHDAEPIVRGACAWALGQYDSEAAAGALSARLPQEEDNEVRVEIAAALDKIDNLSR